MTSRTHKASFEDPPFTILAQAVELGGAERSLLESLSRSHSRPFFVLRGAGSLAKAIVGKGWEFVLVPLPPALETITQRGGMQEWLFKLPAIFRALPNFRRQLRQAIPQEGAVLSVGVKYHVLSLLLGPSFNARRIFDIRDFIRPQLLRKFLGWCCEMRFARAIANSRAVGQDYPGVQIRYPEVTLPAPPLRIKKRSDEKRIITHLAYFAPYKGQDYFLELATAWLALDPALEFWIIGEVIYPSPSYLSYREKLMALAANPALKGKVIFWGAVQDPHQLQRCLEQTDLLLHCTREPEPFGRTVMEALLTGCETVCHAGSGVCEVTETRRDWPEWMRPLQTLLGNNYVRVVALADKGG